MGKQPKVKSYPSYSKTRTPRDLSIARELEAMRRANPVAWRDRVLDAVRDKRGNVRQAAELLGIGYRTVVRWLATDPPLNSAVDKIRTSARKEREREKHHEHKEAVNE